MTDYTDVPQVNSLYFEQQQIRSAIDYLSTGGIMTTLTILPPVAPPNPSPTIAKMMVTINLPTPNPQALVDQALAAFQLRDEEITQQLADLGVTNTPSSQRSKTA